VLTVDPRVAHMSMGYNSFDTTMNSTRQYL
jgi:hypothetical protein